MIVKQLLRLLESHGDSALHIRLPTGEFVPGHFHVTEVGRIQRTFVDCGGTRRETVACLLQAWAADDVEHRLRAGKLLSILRLAEPILGSVDLPLEIEYGAEFAVQYSVKEVEVNSGGLVFNLVGKRTDCLARETCGVGECCGGSGCC